MRYFPVLTVAALAVLAPTTAQAAPRGSIACPFQALSAKDRAGLGASMVKDANASDAMTAAHDFIAAAAKPCAKSNGWDNYQTEIAIVWTEWNLMSDQVQRDAGLADADVTILRGYVDEDTKRVVGLEHLSSFERSTLFEELHKRGARFGDTGDNADRTIEIMMLAREMRAQEVEFSAS